MSIVQRNSSFLIPEVVQFLQHRGVDTESLRASSKSTKQEVDKLWKLKQLTITPQNIEKQKLEIKKKFLLFGSIISFKGQIEQEQFDSFLSELNTLDLKNVIRIEVKTSNYLNIKPFIPILRKTINLKKLSISKLYFKGQTDNESKFELPLFLQELEIQFGCLKLITYEPNITYQIKYLNIVVSQYKVDNTIEWLILLTRQERLAYLSGTRELFKKNPNLKKLKISYFRGFEPNVLSENEIQLPNLEELDLSESLFDVYSLEILKTFILKKFPKLKKLDLPYEFFSLYWNQKKNDNLSLLDTNSKNITHLGIGVEKWSWSSERDSEIKTRMRSKWKNFLTKENFPCLKQFSLYFEFDPQPDQLQNLKNNLDENQLKKKTNDWMMNLIVNLVKKFPNIKVKIFLVSSRIDLKRNIAELNFKDQKDPFQQIKNKLDLKFIWYHKIYNKLLDFFQDYYYYNYHYH